MENALAGSVGIAAYLALFAGVGFVFVFVNLLVGRFLRPQNPHPEKLEIYECGEPAIGSSFVQFDLRFYVIALIFIVFDVEVAFLFPWATVFGKASHLANASLEGTNATENITLLSRELGGLDASESLGAPDQIVQGASSLVGIAAIEMLVFFAILLVAYAYVWRVGALDWVRALTDQRPDLERPEPKLRVASQRPTGTTIPA